MTDTSTIIENIKNILDKTTHASLDHERLSHFAKQSFNFKLLDNDMQRAYYTLHRYFDTNFGIGIPTSVDVGDVSVSIDNSLFNNLPYYLKPVIANLNTTPYGRQLILDLTMQSDDVSATGHVGDDYRNYLDICKGSCDC